MERPDDLIVLSPDDRRRMTRRALLKAGAGVGVAAGLGYWGWRTATGGNGQNDTIVSSGSGQPTDSDDLVDNVQSGGPPKDGIPAIDEPQFVGADEADFLSGDDVVFGLVRDEEARAYPQLVLVWHEIVNDELPDGPLSVTYCPLTGSGVGFRGEASDGTPYDFGTTGNLVNSNLLMYDRQTDSEWPQILGAAITGPRAGESLEEVALDWTTWERWRQAHPDTVVLSTDSGFLRSYGEDPYGSYTPLSGYYDDDRLLFDVVNEDDRLPRKDVVIGVKHGQSRLAVPKSLVAEQGVVREVVDGEPVVVLYDPALDAGRAFLERLPDGDAALSPTESKGSYRDDASGSVWDATGTAVDGPLQGSTLPQLTSMDVMWFAWIAFYPQTTLLS